MSSNPIPVTAATVPFIATTTPTIERANRLMSLRAHPGFLDLIRLSQEMVQGAVDICTNYPGWDAQQIVVLKVRQQAATEHHQMLFAKMEEAIQQGIQDARSNQNPTPDKTAADAVDQGDYVRQAVLQRFDENDNRVAGSF
jgi:hypothetical protein